MYTSENEFIVIRLDLKVHLYADDCTVYLPFEDFNQSVAEAKMSDCIDEIKTWMNRNFLKLNSNKTAIMLFSSNKRGIDRNSNNFTLIENNNVIKASNNVKLLGVVLGK